MDNTHNNQMYEQCKKHMHSYVLAELSDGTTFDGIITGLDQDQVYFAVPMDSYEAMTMPAHHEGYDYGQGQYGYPTRQFGYGFGYPGYGYPGYGYGPGYGFGRPRRFRRLVIPLAALTALALLPWY